MSFKGGPRKKANLKFDREFYTPMGAKELTEKQMKQEYSRLRSIARKRLERFEGTEWTTAQIYKQNIEGFPTLAEIKEADNPDRVLRHALSDVARFVTSKRGSVSGLEKERRTAIETFHEHGYDFVTKENFREFTEFMEYARVANQNRLYDSKRVADFYASTERQNLSKEELRDAFRTWRRKQRKQEKVQNRKRKSDKQFRKAMD